MGPQYRPVTLDLDRYGPLLTGPGKELWEIASKVLDFGGVSSHNTVGHYEDWYDGPGQKDKKDEDKRICQLWYLQISKFLITSGEAGTNIW